MNNNCATGSSALYLASQMIKGSVCECALALGFDRMEAGSLTLKYTNRTNALDKIIEESHKIL